MAMLPDIAVTVLGDDERDSTLVDVCRGKVGVIDLWHTKCQKCPAALDKFNTEMEQFSSEEVLFIACALSLGSGNKEDVAELGPETWANVTHVFVEESIKEKAKAAFGYTSVPFYVVFNKDGSIRKMGEPKSVDYVAEVKAALAETSAGASGGVVADASVGIAANVAELKIADSAPAAPVAAAPAHVFTLDEDF